jgi:reactive intermediate/imine deaminase
MTSTCAPATRNLPSLATLCNPLNGIRDMPRTPIHSADAPKAIGPYSQAIRSGNTLYLSGQTPLDPATGEMVAGDIDAQATRVFENLKAVLSAAGASFDDVVRVAIYMTDLGNFATVNEVMKRYFREPYPARSTIGVAALPRGAAVEVDLIAVTGG